MSTEREIANFLIGYTEAPESNKLRDLISQYSEGLYASNRYSWAGFVEVVDIFERNHLFVYLLDKNLMKGHRDFELFTEEERSAKMQMSNAAVKLTLALRPAIGLNEFYMDADLYTPDQAKTDIMSWVQAIKDQQEQDYVDARLIWETEIPIL